MTYAIHEHEAIQVVQVHNLLNELENKAIIQEVEQLVQKGKNAFIVDLSELNFMNSIGLNFLIKMMSTSKETNGFLAIANPNEQVLNLLEITKLKSLFNLTPSVEEAFRQLEIST